MIDRTDSRTLWVYGIDPAHFRERHAAFVHRSMQSTSGRQRRKPRKVTSDSLRNAALHYLERYASSAGNLRQVLRRRVLRAARFHETDRDQADRWIEEIVAGFQSSGILDDAAYAEARVQSMFRQGRSLRAMARELKKKDVADDDIARALDALGSEHGDPNRAAAIRYARKRRLGPFRTDDRDGRRERDLAAMARAGFDYDTARGIIDAEDGDSLEQDDLSPV